MCHVSLAACFFLPQLHSWDISSGSLPAFFHPMVCSTGEGLSKPVSQESGNAGELLFLCTKSERKTLRQ